MTERKIECVVVSNDGLKPEVYCVGERGVTLIEQTTKPGMNSDIPYIRLWKRKTLLAEWCQHGIVGIYFEGELDPSKKDEGELWWTL